MSHSTQKCLNISIITPKYFVEFSRDSKKNEEFWQIRSKIKNRTIIKIDYHPKKEYKKSRRKKLRRPSPPLPWKPDYNLHRHAGGSPLLGFSASNFRKRSTPPREACNSPRNVASLIRNVGLIRLLTHTAGLRKLLCHIFMVHSHRQKINKKKMAVAGTFYSSSSSKRTAANSL